MPRATSPPPRRSPTPVESAPAWHHWAARTLLAHARRIDQALEAVRTDMVTAEVMMPARFTLDGLEEPHDPDDPWPNFQTDCYGFWLWAAADHVRLGGELTSTLRAGMELAVRYLMGVAEVPCFDCWEEHPGNRHTSTLGVNAAGLRDAGALLGDDAATAYAAVLTERVVSDDHLFAGSIVRFPGDTRVDGSLLWLATPFGVVDHEHPAFTATVQRITQELHRPGGGVQRYLGDTFFGGSEWILLTASLAWTLRDRGEGGSDLCQQLETWIAQAADADGHLPEHVPDHVQSPYTLEYWRGRWGTPANPLLWSHAMHLVLGGV